MLRMHELPGENVEFKLVNTADVLKRPNMVAQAMTKNVLPSNNMFLVIAAAGLGRRPSGRVTYVRQKLPTVASLFLPKYARAITMSDRRKARVENATATWAST